MYVQGDLFLLCAEFRRWQVPQAKNDLRFDVLVFIAITFAGLAYAGYAVALARAISGHLHLSMPGTLLPTGAHSWPIVQPFSVRYLALGEGGRI